MLVQGKSDKYLLVYRACHRVAWNKIRKLECIGKKGKMCEEKEVVKLGLLPGAVPPFPALIGVKGIIDSKFKTIERVAFNAGLRTKSIVMDTKDFVWVQFAE